MNRLEKFQKEKESLDGQKEKIEKLAVLVERQKAALHYVKPAFDLLERRKGSNGSRQNHYTQEGRSSQE